MPWCFSITSWQYFHTWYHHACQYSVIERLINANQCQDVLWKTPIAGTGDYGHLWECVLSIWFPPWNSGDKWSSKLNNPAMMINHTSLVHWDSIQLTLIHINDNVCPHASIIQENSPQSDTAASPYKYQPAALRTSPALTVQPLVQPAHRCMM